MALPTYSTGTVSVAVGGTVVTGSGGMWSGINVKQGDFISINSLPAVLITEVTDTTHLMIPPWGGAAQTGVAYVIYQNYVGRVVGVAAAEDVGDMLERLRDQAPIYNVPAGETEPDPSYGVDGQYAYQVGTDTWWVKDAGAWVELDGPPGVGSGVPVGAAPFDALAYNGMQVNGAMVVSQEKAYGATTTTGYVCDGWGQYYTSGIVRSATVFEFAASTFGIPTYLWSLVTTAKASLAAGDLSIVYQIIEGHRVNRLAWGTAVARPISIGFWVNSVRTGTYCGWVQNASSATRSYVFTFTQNVASAWEYKTVTIPGDTIGTWGYGNGVGMLVGFTQAAGSDSSTSSIHTWISGNFKAATSQVNGVAATSDVFGITGVIVLPGSQVPTAEQLPLIMRPYDQELATCQRYYNKGVSIAGGYSPSPAAVPTFGGAIQFPATMRAAPTVVASGGTPSGATGLTADQPTVHGFRVYALPVTAGTNWFWDGFSYTADARL